MLTHVGTYSGLGYFVPTGFVDRIEQATKWFAPLTEDGVFSVIRTGTGQPLPFPFPMTPINRPQSLAKQRQ